MNPLQNPFQFDIAQLEEKAKELRIDVIKTLAGLPSGHTGGPLGMADVFAALYFNIMQYDPKDVYADQRDRIILSNGHICPILYVAMAHAGYFPKEELKTLRKINSRLQGHPWNLSLPGIEVSSGPLGQGISQAAGIALAAKLKKKDYRVFCLVSDAENQEGQFWEAMLFANKYKLDNLYIIVDKNNIEIDGFVQDIMPIEPLDKKYEAFNFDVFQMDGNDMADILFMFNKAFETSNDQKPKIISANTILGYGVPFMEAKYEWHGKTPTIEEADAALKYLEQI